MGRLLLSLVILGGMTSATWAWPPSDQASPRKTLRLKVIVGQPLGAEQASPRKTLRPKTIAQPPPAAEEPLGAEAPAATVDQRTKAALASEPQGLDSERNAAFQAVLQADPDHAPARWGAGHVRIEGDWLTSDEAAKRFREDDRLAIYRRFREERWPDTIAGQWEAARWCARQHLPQQRQAHLNRVLLFDPDNLEARRLLGHQRVGDRWLTANEVARSNLQAREAADAMRKWKPRLLRILEDLTHRSQIRRKQAAQRLSAIDDPGAVWAMESVLSTQGEATALLMIQSFDGISAPQAAVALTRQTLLSPHESVRKAALEALKKREYETYVPLLLGMLTTPIQSRLAISQGPGQGLVYRQELYREGQETRHLVQLSADYSRVAPDVSDYGGMQGVLHAAIREADQRDMVRHAAARAQSVAMAVTAQNDRIHQSNERICAILSKATGQAVPPVPEQWWQWWYAYNDVFVAAYKPVVAEARHNSVIMASNVPRAVYAPMAENRPETGPEEPSDDFQPWQEVDRESRLIDIRESRFVIDRSGAAGSRDCLAAGTRIWTDLGSVAIEQITIGDLVLSQDIQTGELAYKPVLQTTLRPIGPLMEIDVAGRAIQTSGGHPFWISGAGWTKARDLEPGSRFHAVAATALVGPIAKGPHQVTHNLVVADFHTYFIGEAKVLVHDNTIHQPTAVVVPGLAAR